MEALQFWHVIQGKMIGFPKAPWLFTGPLSKSMKIKPAKTPGHGV